MTLYRQGCPPTSRFKRMHAARSTNGGAGVDRARAMITLLDENTPRTSVDGRLRPVPLFALPRETILSLDVKGRSRWTLTPPGSLHYRGYQRVAVSRSPLPVPPIPYQDEATSGRYSTQAPIHLFVSSSTRSSGCGSALMRPWLPGPYSQRSAPRRT